MARIRNVHERAVRAPASAVAPLLDRLSAEDDPIFPVPGWAPMRLDGPLAVGAAGGHGPVTYRVTAYEPGRRIRFDGTPPWDGYHELTVEAAGDDGCRVRHVLEMRFAGVRLLAWIAGIRPVHDAMIEELFDNIELIATGTVARPAKRSPRVRLLRRLVWARPESVTAPEHARLIRTALEHPRYADAYRMPLQPGLPRDPEAWTGILRGRFPVLAKEDGELLMRVDTAGVTARASIVVDDHHVTLCTVAGAESLRGKLYWGLVRRVHPVMARTMLRRVHRNLAGSAPSAAERFLSSRG
ncbi:DUF2867 domain-containing protein [Streptomyces sp. SID5785]|uniref:SRPBCC family protein n=1 Tax=Streptomyces sp. SID5785 TaxID=2690309 RepID=UPI00136101F7|nr:SRPBCC family protein [Streptomyces sp. SID5785]MZD10474.1 DUF2867 domain-containing protein [Streptomyces sp. SID5785]